MSSTVSSPVYSAQHDVVRVHLSLNQARNWSIFVGWVRIILPSLALLLALTFMGFLIRYSIANAQNGMARFVDQEIVTMVNPRFTGRDANGASFVILASTASRIPNTPSQIDLSNPIFEDAIGSSVKASKGIYDRNAGTLNLSGSVHLIDSEGYEFTSESAVFFVADRKFVGESPLSGFGPLGKINADSFEVLEQGERVVLTGNVEMVIFNGSDKSIDNGLKLRD